MKSLFFKNRLLILLLLIFLFSNVIALSTNQVNVERTGNIDTRYTGDFVDFIIVDGRIRSYWVHVPPTYDKTTPMPLVLVLHGIGYGANSASMKSYSEFDRKADEQGFITVYPNGEILRLRSYYNHPIVLLWDLYALITFSRTWNRWDDNEIDDVKFINTLISHLETKLMINSSRIYITGFSGGAMMTYRLGAELSDRIAAIAPVAGTIGGLGYVPEKMTEFSPYIIPDPISPIPVLALHGKNDIPVPFDGGWKKVREWNNDELWVYTVSVNESISFWIENNNCSPNPEITYSDNGRIVTSSYKSIDDKSDVVLVTYLDGGHE